MSEIGDDLWGNIQVQDALKAWVHAVSSLGQFNEGLEPQTEVGPDPIIHLAPALILRRRTERSLLRVFQEIIKQLRDGYPLPMGVRRLVTIMDDDAGFIDEDKRQRGSYKESLPLREIYFPLPANQEQLEIVRKLSTRQGILVQGPPGTGKSHTIANLVCHLLAEGQRVLVTSHAARALKVLRDKFPKEILDLCVILLGDDLDAMQGLEDSVRSITEHYNKWDKNENRRRIANFEKQLDEARRDEASTLTELRAIREAETYRYPPRLGTYEGTAQAIANRLREEASRYAWVSVRPEEEVDSPLSDTEALELLRLLREIISSREEELSKVVVDPDSLISPGEFVILIKKEVEARSRYQAAAAHREHAGYPALVCANQEQRETLVARLSDLRTTYEALIHHVHPWVKKAAIEILTDQDRVWGELLTITREHLQIIGNRARKASECQISGLADRNRSVVKAHAKALLQHLETGGRLGFGPFRPKVVKDGIYLIKKVHVDGQLCNSLKPLRDLIECFEIADRLNALRTHWLRHTRPRPGSFIVQVAEHQDFCGILEKALELKTKVQTLKEIIATIPGLMEPSWNDLEDLRALKEAAEAVPLEEEFKGASSRFNDLENCLLIIAANPNVHPVVRQVLEAVRARNDQRYGATFQTLQNLQRSREELERHRTLLHRLKIAVPTLASQLMSSFADRGWDNRMAEFTAAWNWARASRWLVGLNDPRAQEQLSNNLARHRSRICEIIQDLAAAKAWGHCLSRLLENQRQHLMAWKDAIRRGGKGTGRYAAMHRRAAREHMDQCRPAIPAWIMPIYRAAENIRAGMDTFDVVIIDEASQSGPEALFLLYLAKKIIVVGDDKQISPDFVGITREDVELLRQRHIIDIPHSDALGVDTSFFTQAEIRYGGRIRLREHFRCMPEIIQFSNNLCYRSEPLVPLRQYGTGRLTPVVTTRHVPDGYQKGHSPSVTNPPEAETIADQIRECCGDPAYEGKTMGVISLLGDEQAKLVEKLLLEKISPEEMEKRQLICGDAYAFQGDERDIMFLSLVSAPTGGSRIGVLASARDERRFNVAASRAKDQVWLFHTATLNDLNPNCLRHRLLQYYQNPKVETTTVEGRNVDSLRAEAKSVDRDRVKPPPPFGSWFEVDVFLKIAEREFWVIPQFEIAGYYIDLVIEGMQGRLAVECDGDTWHGADRYEQDTARQRMLERCGWTFWRVRGSSFYFDPDRAMEGLWEKLNELNIKPKADNARPYKKTPDSGKNSTEKPEAKQSLEKEGKELTKSKVVDDPKTGKGEPKEDEALMKWLADVSKDAWFSIAKWGKENNKLTPRQRSVAYNIGMLVSKGKSISIDQAKYAYIIYEKAEKLGFKKKS